MALIQLADGVNVPSFHLSTTLLIYIVIFVVGFVVGKKF